MHLNTSNLPSSRRDFLKTCTIATGAWALSPLLNAQPANQPFRLGIDALAQSGFTSLAGKNIGLLTHPAGVNAAGVSTIQVLRNAPQVRLVALFGPEHGIYGNEKANVPIADRTDQRTGLPVYSLYGKYRRPTPAMLSRIDAMVVDLQDIGSRSYTYVSCMRYVMEACFQNGKEVIILDRPNPLGGIKIDGPGLDWSWRSYVGAFPVPYVHGMTIGELATMARQQKGIMEIDDADRARGKLQVIRMTGWTRDTLWPQTRLSFVPTSPAIPDVAAALGYPITGLGSQLGSFSHGYGTLYPFRLIQYTGRKPEDIRAALASRRISGLEFKLISFQEKTQHRRATYVAVNNYNALRPTELSLHMMQLACEWSGANPFSNAPGNARDLFTKHVGDPAVLETLASTGSRFDPNPFLQKWSQQNQAFNQQRQQWLLY